MLLAEVARVSRLIAQTSSRTEKVALLAGLFRGTGPEDAPVVITYLAGRLPQRRTGIGWRTPSPTVPPADAPSLSVADVHQALDAIAAVSGRGAQAERGRLLRGLLSAATGEEQRFLVRLIGGELRQGALDAFAVEGLAAAVDEDKAAEADTVEAEDALAAARRARSEPEVRRILAGINERIRAALRMPPPGPPLGLEPFDADEVVREGRGDGGPRPA